MSGAPASAVIAARRVWAFDAVIGTPTSLQRRRLPFATHNMLRHIESVHCSPHGRMKFALRLASRSGPDSTGHCRCLMRPESNNRIARLSLRNLSLPDGFSALQHRNYRLYFFGQAVSVTGTWMQSLAMSWLVLTLTCSAIKLSLVNVLQFAPTLVFGLFAGVVADRVPKRSCWSSPSRSRRSARLTLAILIWTDHIDLWHVYLLALIVGINNSFDMPARQAFVSEMVGSGKICANAIALNSTLFNMGRLVGPALAGTGARRVRGRGLLSHRRIQLPGGHLQPVDDAQSAQGRARQSASAIRSNRCGKASPTCAPPR